MHTHTYIIMYQVCMLVVSVRASKRANAIAQIAVREGRMTPPQKSPNVVAKETRCKSKRDRDNGGRNKLAIHNNTVVGLHRHCEIGLRHLRVRVTPARPHEHSQSLGGARASAHVRGASGAMNLRRQTTPGSPTRPPGPRASVWASRLAGRKAGTLRALMVLDVMTLSSVVRLAACSPMDVTTFMMMFLPAIFAGCAFLPANSLPNLGIRNYLFSCGYSRLGADYQADTAE